MKLMIKSISLLLCVFTLFVVGCAKVEAPTPTGTMPSQDITPDLPTPSERPTPTPKPTRTPEPTPAPTANEAYRLKGEVIEIASFKIGSGKDNLAYDPKPAPMTVSGPSSFYVDESGWLAVLDTCNWRIAIFDKDSDGKYKYREEIYFEDAELIFQMEYINETFYVTNYYGGSMYTVDYVYGEDNSTNEIRKYNFPEDMTMTPLMWPLADGVYLSDLDEGDYWFVDGKFKRPEGMEGLVIEDSKTYGTTVLWDSKTYYNIRLDEQEWKFEFVDEDPVYYGIDNELNIVLGVDYHYEDDYDHKILEIRKYDRYCNELGSVEFVNYNKIDRFPWQGYRVLPSGKIYYMACYEDRVCFYEIR